MQYKWRKQNIYVSLEVSKTVCLSLLTVSCLRALKKGDFNEFHGKLKNSKQVIWVSTLSFLQTRNCVILFMLCVRMCQELVWCVSRASEESTEHIYSAIIKLQVCDKHTRQALLNLFTLGFHCCQIFWSLDYFSQAKMVIPNLNF